MLAKILTLSFALLLSMHSYASGTIYGGGSSYDSRAAPKVVDQRYEQGKALVTGKAKAYKKIKLCVQHKDKKGNLIASKPKSKYLKSYKGQPVSVLAKKLVQCDNLEVKILDYLSRDEAITALYYLNKRFNLRLK